MPERGTGAATDAFPPCVTRSRCALGWLVYAIVACVVVACFGVAPT